MASLAPHHPDRSVMAITRPAMLRTPPIVTREDAHSAVTRHRATTELALARIRLDPTLTDLEKAQRISSLLAEANARALTIFAEARRARQLGRVS